MAAAFDSSDKALVDGWNWAVAQALEYVRHGDPVGDWFESSLPGRNAFCMRDIAHQSAGGQVLGLRDEIKNMLRRFAENISASRDWCTFWEITGDNLPAEVDYLNDQDFWYNLPANFDLLDCCWRQYLWTADADYVTDPVFLNFYDRTVSDYVRHWDSDGDGIPENHRQFGRRGIASYEEAIEGIHIGGDLIAAQIAAYDAYAHIQQVRGSAPDAELYREKASSLRTLYNASWWNPDAETFFSFMRHDRQFSSRIDFNINNLALYFGAVHDRSRIDRVLEGLMRDFPNINVEAQSYFPEVAYRFGSLKPAYETLRYLISPQLPRREYPEISYSVLGTIVTGMMGISSNAAPSKVTSIGRLTDDTAWCGIEQLPILDNQIALSHTGNHESVFENQHGKTVLWEARFSASTAQLLVDGAAQPAKQAVGRGGQSESWVTLLVPPGENHRVTLP